MDGVDLACGQLHEVLVIFQNKLALIKNMYNLPMIDNNWGREKVK